MTHQLVRNLIPAIILIISLIHPGYSAIENPHGDISYSCDQCHSTGEWKELLPVLKFVHTATGFPLEGQHRTVECRDCHESLEFGRAQVQCSACHTDIHQNQFGNSCEECHSPKGWLDYNSFRIKHQSSQFPLLGPHAQLDCQNCHQDQQYVNLPLECIGCHLQDYQATLEPSHINVGFSTNCTDCHSLNSVEWHGVPFQHAQNFPLENGHRLGSCSACHLNSLESVSSGCFGCHQPEYFDANDPDHAAGQFSHLCQECHNTQTWDPSTFDHNTTRFQIAGAHTGEACETCHQNGQFAGTPADCWSCHEDNYNGVTDPNHLAGQFDHDCTICHTDAAWTPATFDHSQTAFPLSGAHTTASCELCHIDGQFAGTPADCWSCHEENFNGVSDPDHQAGQFDHDCTICHTDAAWTPATFDHDETEFPLTGAHVVTPCSECHINGQYSGTPTECFFCHEDNYNSTTNPNHSAAGYPPQCESCHSTNNWNSNFNHDQLYFPIYTGEHREEWNTCADCHPIPSNFSVFSCIDCHEHNQPDMDDDHDEVTGYVYESNACLNCHPDGNSDSLPESHKKSKTEKTPSNK